MSTHIRLRRTIGVERTLILDIDDVTIDAELLFLTLSGRLGKDHLN